MSAPQPVKTERVYAAVDAADAFARRLLIAHGLTSEDAAMLLASGTCVISTKPALPSCAKVRRYAVALTCSTPW